VSGVLAQLPAELLKMKLRDAIDNCQDYLDDGIIIAETTYENRIPISITISINNHPAPISLNDRKDGFVYGTVHSFKITFGRSFPYQPPVVQWLTPIYHPNIASPSEGGRVCLKAIDSRQFEFNLTDLIKSVVQLLAHPNPTSPLDTRSCTEAAEVMNNHRN
jgi:ubiquitin-protein ligase